MKCLTKETRCGRSRWAEVADTLEKGSGRATPNCSTEPK
jgi:hypothetical protein